MEPCQVSENGRIVTPCKQLSDACEYGNPTGRKKGIFGWTLYKPSESELSRQFFGVKSGEFVDRGLAFNFCPFCGTQIDAPFAEKESEE